MTFASRVRYLGQVSKNGVPRFCCVCLVLLVGNPSFLSRVKHVLSPWMFNLCSLLFDGPSGVHWSCSCCHLKGHRCSPGSQSSCRSDAEAALVTTMWGHWVMVTLTSSVATDLLIGHIIAVGRRGLEGGCRSLGHILFFFCFFSASWLFSSERLCFNWPAASPPSTALRVYGAKPDANAAQHGIINSLKHDEIYLVVCLITWLCGS